MRRCMRVLFSVRIFGWRCEIRLTVRTRRTEMVAVVMLIEASRELTGEQKNKVLTARRRWVLAAFYPPLCPDRTDSLIVETLLEGIPTWRRVEGVTYAGSHPGGGGFLGDERSREWDAPTRIDRSVISTILWWPWPCISSPWQNIN